MLSSSDGGILGTNNHEPASLPVKQDRPAAPSVQPEQGVHRQAAFNREIDPGKWEQMLTATTIPFELSEPGVKIAVKVIDQTGMEHMTVIDNPRDEIRRETNR